MLHEPLLQVDVKFPGHEEPNGTDAVLLLEHDPPFAVLEHAPTAGQLEAPCTEQLEYEYGATLHEPLLHVDVRYVQLEPDGTLGESAVVQEPLWGVAPQAPCAGQLEYELTVQVE